MEDIYANTFEAARARSAKLEEDLVKQPANYRVLTGDRPTGRLHIGHLFGSLQNRVRLQNLGVNTFIVIAHYQVLTDRDTFENIADNIHNLVIDYIAAGLDPDTANTCIFPHSHVPSSITYPCPSFTLGLNGRLPNPTVKEEIQAAGLSRINAGHVHLSCTTGCGHPSAGKMCAGRQGSLPNSS